MIITKRNPDTNSIKDPEGSQDNPNQGLESAMSDLIDAIHNKDTKAAMSAFKSAFEMLEMELHDEADHEEQEPQE